MQFKRKKCSRQNEFLMFHINPIVNINRKWNDLCICWLCDSKLLFMVVKSSSSFFDSEMCLTRAREETAKCRRTVCVSNKEEEERRGKNSMKIIRLQTIIINKGWQVKNIRFITNWIKTNKIVSDTDTYPVYLH